MENIERTQNALNSFSLTTNTSKYYAEGTILIIKFIKTK